MRAIERSPQSESSFRPQPVHSPLEVVRSQPRRARAKDRWFVAVMFASLTLLAIVLAKFVVHPAIQTLGQPESAWTSETP